MDFLTLPNRSVELFGRAAQLDILMDRAKQPSVTLVTGRPKAGKTWLLQELARQLDNIDAAVGYYEIASAEDPMLRCVRDLYSRWLAKSTHCKQFEVLWRRYVTGVVSIGTAFGAIFETLSTALGSPLGPAGSIVTKIFKGLEAAQDDLKNGGLSLPRLTNDTVYDLVSLVNAASHSRTILIVDAIDQATTIEPLRSFLEAFLHSPDRWSQTHVFLGARLERVDPAIQSLMRMYPGTKELEVSLLELDELERAALVQQLRVRLDRVNGIDRADLFSLGANNPAVLHRWLHSLTPPMTELKDLEAEADNAIQNLYPELKPILQSLTAAERAAVMLLIILPAFRADDWEQYGSALFLTVDGAVFESLLIKGILETLEPPSLGHATRKEALLLSVINDRRLFEILRREARSLIDRLDRALTKQDPSGEVDADESATRSLAIAVCSCTHLLEAEIGDDTAAIIACIGRGMSEKPFIGLFLPGVLAASKRWPQLECRIVAALMESLAAADSWGCDHCVVNMLHKVHMDHGFKSPTHRQLQAEVLNWLLKAKKIAEKQDSSVPSDSPGQLSLSDQFRLEVELRIATATFEHGDITHEYIMSTGSLIDQMLRGCNLYIYGAAIELCQIQRIEAAEKCGELELSGSLFLEFESFRKHIRENGRGLFDVEKRFPLLAFNHLLHAVKVGDVENHRFWCFRLVNALRWHVNLPNVSDRM